MHPILFKLKIPLLGVDFPVHTFGVLVALASLAAMVWIRREARDRGLNHETLVGIAVETLLVGVVGSRLLFIIITPEAFAGRSWFSYVNIREGGLVWYGGFLPAAVFAILRGRQHGLPWRTVADAIAPAVMLGLSIGRLGCLSAGDDHGKIADGPHWWTLIFHEIRDQAGNLAPPNEQPLMDHDFIGKPLYPSQPLMAIGAFTIFLITALTRKRLADRPLAVSFLMAWLYAIHRFLVEFTRGDKIRKFFPVELPLVGPISTSQAIGIPIFLVCFGLWLRLMLRPPVGRESSPPTPAEAVMEEQQRSAS